MNIQKKLLIAVVFLSVLCASPALVLYYRAMVFSKTFDQIPQSVNDLAKASSLNSVSQYIRYYDEVLTQSARNYAFTGDPLWKDHYNSTVPLLDEMITEAIKKGTIEEKIIFKNVDDANQALIVMEQKSFRLVDQGQKISAQAVLDSSDYAEQKRIYQKGLEEYFASRGKGYTDTLTVSTQVIDNAVSGFQKNLGVNLGITFLISIFCIFAGFFVYFFVKVIIFRRLDTLIRATEEIGKGNLSYHVDGGGNDEIGVIITSFNAMVEAVRNSKKEIEKRVEEQTAEIALKAKDMEDQQKATLNLLEDVDKEKEKFANEKTRLETILASIGDGVFVTDNKGRIELINNSALRMSGFSLPESLGKFYSETVRFRLEDEPEKKYKDFVGKVLETGEMQSLQNHTIVLHKDGSSTSVLDSAAPILDTNGKVHGCVVVFRDNTRERELEKSKDDFLSVAAHQLRTPLGSMRWNLEMLLGGDLGKISLEVAGVIGQIYTSNSRMITLVNDLLNVSRIDQGRVKDEPMKTDIVKVIQEAIHEMVPLTAEKSIEIDYLAKKKKIPEIMIDPKRFREVVQNLLSNAVKYNVQKGKVGVDLEIKDKQVVIEIVDTGLGIPEKAMPQIFSKFFRADNAVLAQTEGSGLGLFVVKKYVESWGGQVSVESKIGKGTTVTISLPLEPSSHILDNNLKDFPHQI